MHLDAIKGTFGSLRTLTVDTTLVLFFLGLEFGRTLGRIDFDSFLMLGTVGMVMVLPYYLLANSERPAFAKWLIGRGLITILAVAAGSILSMAYGTVLPESFRFLPLTLLILAAMTSCIIRFHALMRLDLAK